jgi:hypothetical protein
MLLNELKPFLTELTKEPVAFCSGFVSGLLRLDLNADPVKTWLERQGATPSQANTSNPNDERSPQSIDIE